MTWDHDSGPIYNNIVKGDMRSRLRILVENAWPGLMLKCQVKWEKYEFHRGSDTIEHFQIKNLVALLKLSNNYNYHLWHLQSSI